MKLSLFTLGLLATSLAYAGAPPDEPPPTPDTVCPANASQLIQGGPWAFQLREGARSSITTMNNTLAGLAAIGTFTALPGGTLTATLTVSNTGVIARRATVGGRYIVYSDCSGGEVMIMLNGFAAQLEFVWTNGFTQMLFVSDALNPRYNANVVVLTGNARRAPLGCPAGLGNSLNILDKTIWSYRLSQNYLYLPGDASVGTLKPFVSGSQGLLTAVETSTTATGLVSRRMSENGRYLIYGDCSGGEIMLMNRAPGSVQLEFVFAGLAFDEMFLLADDASNTADVPLGGQAFRY